MGLEEKSEDLRLAFLSYKYAEGCDIPFIRKCDGVTYEFFEYCIEIRKGLNEIRYYDARNFERYLLNRYLEKSTVNSYVSIVRVFYNYLILVEYSGLNPFRLISAMHVIPIEPPYVPMSEMKRIFQSLDSGFFAPIHFITIFECLYATGMNGMELMFLRTDDFDLSFETITIRATKRKPSRQIPLPTQSVYVLKHYINYRNLRFPFAKFLVVSLRGRKLYYKVLNDAVKTLLAGTAVKQKGVPVMKNTYKRHMLGSGARMESVAALTGKRMQALIRHDAWKTFSEIMTIHKLFHPRG